MKPSSINDNNDHLHNNQQPMKTLSHLQDIGTKKLPKEHTFCEELMCEFEIYLWNFRPQGDEKHDAAWKFHKFISNFPLDATRSEEQKPF